MGCSEKEEQFGSSFLALKPSAILDVSQYIKMAILALSQCQNA